LGVPQQSLVVKHNYVEQLRATLIGPDQPFSFYNNAIVKDTVHNNIGVFGLPCSS
jgi:hypothetical protein